MAVLTRLGLELVDAMLVALSGITTLDPSINETHHLPYGWRAWRVDRVKYLNGFSFQ